MVARAAKLCGMDTTMETLEILERFEDHASVNTWACESMAFCYSEGILDMSSGEIRPKTAILRCEIAQMLYNMLDSAKLL